MKASFLLSFATHIALIAFLFSAPVTLWQASEEPLSVINVKLVTDITVALPPKKKIPSSAKISEKSTPATTKLALFNPSQTPLKPNKKKPQTLIAPPPPSLDTPPQKNITPPKPTAKPTPPSPPAKTITKTTPKRPPQKKPTKTITKKPKKQQPEAAPPDTPTKEKLSLESVLKSLQKRDNSALTAKKTKKALAKTTSNEPSPSSSSSSSSTEKPRLTPSDLTRLKNQLSSCWTILSTESAINHTVKVRIRFDENFRVIDIELPEKEQKGHNPGYLVAADQARSAIMHPSCQPLDLPRDKISSSDSLLLNFNPQAMTGSLYSSHNP